MDNKVATAPKLSQHKIKRKKIPGEELEELNKSLQDLKIEEDSIRVITMNMGHGHDRTPAAMRRVAANLVAKSEFPDILFTQEISAPGSPQWMMELKDCYDCRNTGKEAGVMWDERVVEFREEVGMSKKDAVLKTMKGKTADALSEIGVRTCIVCLKLVGKLQYILAVSWHGMWRRSKGIRVESFQALQEFVLKIRQRYFGQVKPAIVIGGDFNLPLEDRAITLDPSFVLPSYEPSERRAKKVGDETIDFFLHTKEIHLRHVAPLEMSTHEASSFNSAEISKTTAEKLDSMDHDPLKAYIIFTQGVYS